MDKSTSDAEQWHSQSHTTGGKKREGFIVWDTRSKARVCENFPNVEPFDVATKRRWRRLIENAPNLLAALRDIVDQGSNRKTILRAIEVIDAVERAGQ